MIRNIKQSGFSAVELLITLFIAAIFVVTGFQLYGLIIKDGGGSRSQLIASREADNYIESNKVNATDPCTPQTINSTPTISGLGATTVTVAIDCPYPSTTSVSRITSTVTYGSPSQTVSDISYTQPACPNGFISVPGSATYGTSDFCVMKYEAKNSSGTPVSTATGAPWVSITQSAAVNASKLACSYGCHLISEAEWLTIAQNLLSVASNWSGGTVGSGCIFRGNVGTADACGYDGANPESGTGRNSKSSLTLSNGQVIWDFAGNVWELTSGLTTNEPGITGSGLLWREWTASFTNHGTLSPDPFPAMTGVSGANGWNSSDGIGMVYSSSDDPAQRVVLRGGYWNDGTSAGVLALNIWPAPADTSTSFGFRVAK